jgi:hypothetical protein
VNAKKKIEKERITFELPTETLNRIDYLAEKSVRNRSDMLRLLLQMGLDDVELLDKVGLFSALNYGINFFEKFKAAVRDGKVEVEDGKANFPVE